MVVFPDMTRISAARPAVPSLGPAAVLGTVLAEVLAAVLVTGACGTAATPGGGGAGRSTSVAGDATSARSGSGQTVTVGDVRLAAEASVGLATHPADPGVRRMPGLVVEYTLTNAGTTDLVAYDVVPDDLGSGALPADVDPEHAWVYVESGQVRISKQVFSPGPSVRFIAAPVTGVRDLPAGGTLSGRAYVPAPLVLDVPGDDFNAPRAALPADASEFRFCVQVGERTPQMRPSKAGGDVLEAPVVAPAGDDLVCTPPLRIPVA